MSVGDFGAYYGALAVTPVAATNWSYIGAGSFYTATSTLGITGTIVPNVGDLVIVSVGTNTSISPLTSYAISDAGSNGWTAIIAFSSGNVFSCRAWWKVAASSDHNGGSGVLVTVTGSGGSGTIANQLSGEVFRVGGGHSVTGLDLSAVVATGTGGGTTASFSPGSGSGQPSNTDELAWTSFASNNAVSLTGANTFTGTSPAANLAVSESGGGLTMVNQFVGLVQSSATAGSNTWKNTWTPGTNHTVIGATFYYT